jgi:hypothetical protein
LICPCLINRTLNNNNNNKPQEQEQEQRRQSIEPANYQNEPVPPKLSNLTLDDDTNGLTLPLLVQTQQSKDNTIDNEDTTCDTVIMKNEHEYDGIISDENDVTIHQSSCSGEQSSVISNHTPLLGRHDNKNNYHRIRSKSDENVLKEFTSNYSADNKSLR